VEFVDEDWAEHKLKKTKKSVRVFVKRNFLLLVKMTLLKDK
jgi:hypothetical protein